MFDYVKSPWRTYQLNLNNYSFTRKTLFGQTITLKLIYID